MTRGQIFFLGAIVGGFLTFIMLFSLGKINLSGNDKPSEPSDKEEVAKVEEPKEEPDNTLIKGMTLFSQRGEKMQERAFKVKETIDDTHAIAVGNSLDYPSEVFYGVTVLLLGNESDHFYDEQILRVTSKKKFYRVGTYKDNSGFDKKTYPVVSLVDVN